MHRPIAPEPLPLYPAIDAAAVFPVASLGPILSTAATAIARKVQVPISLAAQSVLAAASLAVQAHADVVMPYGQTRPLSLFFATVAASGDRKSTADNEALWPIRQYERRLKQDHDRLVEIWRVEEAVWNAQRKAIEANRDLDANTRKMELTTLGPAPLAPLHPFLTAPDPTVEGLAKAWVGAPASLGVFTAEGGLFVGGHGMSNDHRLKTAATYSHLWDGQPIKRVRAADGISILDGRRLAIHLMIQPEAAGLFLGDPLLRDQGLLSRVLVAAPTSIAGSRTYRDPLPEDERAIHAYGAKLLSILEMSWPMAEGKRNELEPRRLEIDRNALPPWAEFHDHVERQCAAGGELVPVRDFASKVAEHAARIGGVLTLVENPHAVTVSLAAMEQAITLADWYVAEAVRLQQTSRADARLLRAQMLLDWMIETAAARGSLSFTFREILQIAPPSFRTKSAAEEPIQILVQHERVVDSRDRPRTITLVRV